MLWNIHREHKEKFQHFSQLITQNLVFFAYNEPCWVRCAWELPYGIWVVLGPSRTPSVYLGATWLHRAVEIAAFSPGVEKVFFECQVSSRPVSFVWCRETTPRTWISILFVLQNRPYCMLDRGKTTTTGCRKLASQSIKKDDSDS